MADKIKHTDADIEGLLERGWQRGWKVVSEGYTHSGMDRHSVVAWLPDSCVGYDFNVISVPRSRMGPLAVFTKTSKASALEFANLHACVNYPCIYKPSGEICLRDSLMAWGLDRCPTGTALAYAVMLLPNTK